MARPPTTVIRPISPSLPNPYMKVRPSTAKTIDRHGTTRRLSSPTTSTDGCKGTSPSSAIPGLNLKPMMPSKANRAKPAREITTVILLDGFFTVPPRKKREAGEGKGQEEPCPSEIRDPQRNCWMAQQVELQGDDDF